IIKYFFERRRGIKSSTNTKFITFWFVFIFFFMFGISFWVPMFFDRYLMPAAIGFYVLLPVAINYLANSKKYTLIIPSLVCFLFIITSKPNLSNKRNVKEAIDKIIELKTEKTAVYMCPSW